MGEYRVVLGKELLGVLFEEVVLEAEALNDVKGEGELVRLLGHYFEEMYHKCAFIYKEGTLGRGLSPE